MFGEGERITKKGVLQTRSEEQVVSSPVRKPIEDLAKSLDAANARRFSVSSVESATCACATCSRGGRQKDSDACPISRGMPAKESDRALGSPAGDVTVHVTHTTSEWYATSKRNSLASTSADAAGEAASARTWSTWLLDGRRRPSTATDETAWFNMEDMDKHACDPKVPAPTPPPRRAVLEEPAGSRGAEGAGENAHDPAPQT